MATKLINLATPMLRALPPRVARPLATWVVKRTERLVPEVAGEVPAGARAPGVVPEAVSDFAFESVKTRSHNPAAGAGEEGLAAPAQRARGHEVKDLLEMLERAAEADIPGKLKHTYTTFGSAAAFLPLGAMFFGGNTEEAQTKARDEILNRLGNAATAIVNGPPAANGSAPQSLGPTPAAMPAVATPTPPVDQGDARRDVMLNLIFEELIQLKADRSAAPSQGEIACAPSSTADAASSKAETASMPEQETVSRK